ncbi:GntR family transcriptional regulator [Rhodocytophaga aerolata]|uniref:GntR family transcriptional regulator n=1 Tax=Rhodocytophaga aerolata TaxID=455078 RepID=A0ABT8R990_9BACT|nr:GntR family transcriptional regulator [Rhodocytophaga aerolata]MDO1448656.1 GntR family transcriptional regulator [Rhodocytophaga aerolata]
MKNLIQINQHSNRPKYQQISDAVIYSIEHGFLEQGQQLPSISELSAWQNIAKVTVAKAYEELQERGIIRAQHGKGFYVATTGIRSQLNVFLLFDTLNAYKENLYYALKKSLPADTQLHLYFHHYDLPLFASLIENSLGKYNYYVIMPHFNEDVRAMVETIPKDKLVIIDKAVDKLPGDYTSVHQNFEEDIFHALSSGLDLLQAYHQITLVLSTDRFQFIPSRIITGFTKFCEMHQIPYEIQPTFAYTPLQKGEAYLLFSDHDLIDFIKAVNNLGLKLGKDIGLISYDDTPMKEILEGGITVISTNFEQMGRTVGQLITKRAKAKISNPSYLIKRNSL